MLSESERIAILRYVKALRSMARDDKREAALATNPKRREHLLHEHRRRLKEAWRWRRYERDFRASTIRSLLIMSQLKQSLEAA